MAIIRIDRGRIEGVVEYETKCFFTQDTKFQGRVCVYCSSRNFPHSLYELDPVQGLAYPQGYVSQVLLRRINSGDTFRYRRRVYRKISAKDSLRFIGNTYHHVIMFSPAHLQYLWFV